MNRRPRKKFSRKVDVDEIVAKAAGEALSTLMRRALQPGMDRRVRAEVDMYRTFGFTDAEIRTLVQRNWGAVDLGTTAVDRSASRENEARGWLEDLDALWVGTRARLGLQASAQVDH